MSDQPERPRFIVAEITKNWPAVHRGELVSQQLERVIQINAERGYRLHSWRYAKVVISHGDGFCETIVAVFEEVGPGPEVRS